jgi:hypothetical protein
MPERERVSYTLNPATADLLRRTGNAGAYIDDVVRERWAAWQDALAVLRVRGWSAVEIRAAADALNGLRSRAPDDVVFHLELMRGAAEESGVPGKRWSKMIETVASDPLAWWALLVAAAETWARNDAFTAALERV